uniref:Uncharacterized protein n=1 Tax=viral metagenome TaxID=1070528 RepID=A0A6C0JSP2_9ZZZZ
MSNSYKEQITNDFNKAMKRKLKKNESNMLKKNMNLYFSNTINESSYPGTGSVASFIFYLRFNLDCNGKTFKGDGGGFSSPGGGILIGDVYTNNFEKMVLETDRFEFNCTPVYTSLLFFNDESNLLGHFQSGSVSTVLGIGAGSGKWV